MRNKLFLFFALFYSSLFAGWSTPKDIVNNESAYSAAFDGHGNAIVIHASASELFQDICMLGSVEWKSRSLGKLSQLAAVEIGNDSKGDLHLFWVDKSEKVCRFFYLPLLKVARPQLLWYGPKAYESLELGLSEKGDLYCRMVASEDDAVAVLPNGSTKWDIFQRSSTSSRQIKQYEATVNEFKQIQDNSQPSWSRDGKSLIVEVNPRGNRLEQPQKVSFLERYFLADSPLFDDQGRLKLCWCDENIGKLWTDITVYFGTINEKGKLNTDYVLKLAENPRFTAGTYQIESEGAPKAAFWGDQSVILFQVREGKMIDHHLGLPTTNKADEIQLKSCKEGRLMATWLESEGDAHLLRVSIYE